VLGFASQILVTSLVGTSGAADTYYFAFSIVNTISALGIGSASFVLIPLYVEKKERDGVAHANAFANAVLTYSLAAFAGLSALMAVLAGPLVEAFGRFPAALRPLAAHVFAATAPLALLIGAGQLLMALLQARKRFVTPAFMGVLHSILFMGVVAAAWKELRVYALVLATAASLVLQAVVMIWRLGDGGKPGFSLRLPRTEARRILLLGWPLLLSQLLSTTQILASRSIASGLLVGSVAALFYAEALKGVFLDLCVVPIAQIGLPHFSESLARGDKAAAWEQLQGALTALWFMVTPAVVLLLVLSRTLIQVFYQRGVFTTQSTALTASALAFFGIGLLGEAPHYLVCRYFFALKDTATLTWLAVPFTIGYLPAIFFLGRLFEVRGIALGHSLVMIANAAAALFVLRRKVRLPFATGFWRACGKIAFSGLIMLAVVHLTRSFVSTRLLPDFLATFVQIVVVAPAGIAVYLASAALAGVMREVPALSRLMPRKLLS
jgi:putative peptidoglycan lipid II flippase